MPDMEVQAMEGESIVKIWIYELLLGVIEEVDVRRLKVHLEEKYWQPGLNSAIERKVLASLILSSNIEEVRLFLKREMTAWKKRIPPPRSGREA